jgi:TetR/AcrR family transcriptional regulator, tetracycline repressor protein
MSEHGTEATTRRRLSRERVVAAALAIVDRDGLEGLTMRALGRELRVDPMAVYHWVPSKDELLGLIVEAVYGEIPLDTSLLPDGDWKDRFGYAARVFRETLRRHPHALAVLATRPPSGASIGALKPSEFAMGILREEGFPPVIAMQAVTAMANLVIGFVLAEVGLPPGAESDVGSAFVSEEQQAAVVLAMTAEEFPNILEALAGFEFDWDRQFTFGMDVLMRGMEPLRGAG